MRALVVLEADFDDSLVEQGALKNWRGPEIFEAPADGLITDVKATKLLGVSPNLYDEVGPAVSGR